jgi:hypothetical protein
MDTTTIGDRLFDGHWRARGREASQPPVEVPAGG